MLFELRYSEIPELNANQIEKNQTENEGKICRRNFGFFKFFLIRFD